MEEVISFGQVQLTCNICAPIRIGGYDMTPGPLLREGLVQGGTPRPPTGHLEGVHRMWSGMRWTRLGKSVPATATCLIPYQPVKW